MTNIKNKKSSGKEYPPLFDEIVEKVLEEERIAYHNDLVSFDQHAAQVKEQILQGEKAYLMRMGKAVKLLNERFGKQEKLLVFIKV